ncbi:M96 mating-specific protein family [Achlya hypogyna]|uniref:M96 mating-specific protein family n=1 Tax=Achlya hypogyna TaxID=1202772 RepID=A0A1V9Z8M1_ACHHY|nr:M96 mating-specific protein family [Achlya hypogyna]
MEREEFTGHADGLWDVDIAQLFGAPMSHGGNEPPMAWAHGKPPPPRRDPVYEELPNSTGLSNQDISYERKKSRAKITRVEVNAGFDDLLAALRLPNSRKNSRAKIIQYACERIRALESENERLKQQLNATPVHHTAVATTSAPTSLQPNGTTMLWIPCSITPLVSQPPPRLVQLPKAAIPFNKKPRKTSKTVMATTSSSNLMALVDTCPHVLRFFDGVMLTRIAQSCSEWKRLIVDGKLAYLWEALIQQRWRIPKDEVLLLTRSFTAMYHKWKYLDQSMLLPRGAFTMDESVVAMGRAKGVDLWGVLARRSNSRTTRSVWRDGALSVMQIVELRLVVQNMSSQPVSPTLVSIGVHPFQVLDASYGGHFQPRWIAVNGVKCSIADDSVVLHHMDFGVVSVYVSCPHIEFEEVFLSSARMIQMHCGRGTGSVSIEAQFFNPNREVELGKHHA